MCQCRERVAGGWGLVSSAVLRRAVCYFLFTQFSECLRSWRRNYFRLSPSLSPAGASFTHSDLMWIGFCCVSHVEFIQKVRCFMRNGPQSRISVFVKLVKIEYWFAVLRLVCDKTFLPLCSWPVWPCVTGLRQPLACGFCGLSLLQTPEEESLPRLLVLDLLYLNC